MLSVTHKSFMLSFIVLNVVMLNVVMLSVVAPKRIDGFVLGNPLLQPSLIFVSYTEAYRSGAPIHHGGLVEHPSLTYVRPQSAI